MKPADASMRLGDKEMGIGEIGERLRRSTVHIRTKGGRGPGAGSGIIWDPHGIIVTNDHVLGEEPGRAATITVELWDGRTFQAEVKTRDPLRDLAKVRVPAADLPAAPFRPDPPRPGEFVVAIGNPMGFTGALTTGSVHAAAPFPGLGRRRWVQAAIRLAPGNSGGPLADAEGNVVGINTMVVSGGIALAIPSAAVEEFVHKGPKPRLGVSVQPVSLNRQSRAGLLIMSIEPGSPAEAASLLIGDRIVGTTAELADAIDDAIAREGVQSGSGLLKVRFIRTGSPSDREVTISLAGRITREAA